VVEVRGLPVEVVDEADRGGAMALTPADPMMNLRRVNPGFPADSAFNDSVTS
jgi:hypothetical protein